MRYISLIGTGILLCIYQLFFYQTAFGLGWLLFFIPCALYLLLTHEKNTNTLFTIAVLSLAGVFFTLASLTGSTFGQMITITTAVFFTLFAVFLAKIKKPFSWSILTSIFSFPITALVGSLYIWQRYRWHQMHKSGMWSTCIPYIRGIGIAIPILWILIALFRNADPIYNIAATTVLDVVWARLFLTLLLGALFLFVGYTQISSLPQSEQPKKHFSNGLMAELSVFFGAISIIIGTFIAVEVKYLFLRVPEEKLAQIVHIAGYTYSQYVTKGFFELIGAVAVVGITLFYARLRTKGQQIENRMVRLLTIVVGVEIILLIVSAFGRLELYVASHGLSLARSYGGIFLVTLLLLTLYQEAELLLPLRPRQRFILFFLPIVIGVISISSIPIEKIIVLRYPPTVNGTVDYYYLSRMSTNAAVAWPLVISWAKQTAQNTANKSTWFDNDYTDVYWAQQSLGSLVRTIEKTYLTFGSAHEIWQNNIACSTCHPYELGIFAETKKISDLPQYWKMRRGWQAFNLADYQAFRLIQQHPDMAKDITQTLVLLEKITKRFPENWERHVSYDRKTEPLFLE